MKTIFVSIASYRDPVCPMTLYSLYENAEYKDRIYVGICQQNKRSSDVDCVMQTGKDETFQQWMTHHVRIVRIDHQEARGPTYARYFCSQLFANEDYFFQIDSHSLFVRRWDTKLVEMMEQLEKMVHKPILSHYCDIYENYQTDPPDTTPVTTNRSCSVDADGMPFLLGAEYLTPLTHPRYSIFISGQMMCAPGSFVHEVPFDPHLDDLFFGEEMLLTMRSFTHGYDVFTPSKNIVYHAYTREKEPKYWKDRAIEQKPVQMKVKYLLEMDGPPTRRHPEWDVYGNGNVRSVDMFYAWTKIQRPWRHPVTLDVSIFDVQFHPVNQDEKFPVLSSSLHVETPIVSPMISSSYELLTSWNTFTKIFVVVIILIGVIFLVPSSQ